MKIISWNCNCAFRNKIELLQKYKPDIMVIQECESPDFLAQKNCCYPTTSHLWFGKSWHKGIGILTFGTYHAKVADFYCDDFPYIIPVEIDNGHSRFLLFAVWTQTCSRNHAYNGYVVYATRAMQYYQKFLTPETVIIGDFNSNQIWLKHFKRKYNHEALIKTLDSSGMKSVYHALNNSAQGQEAEATIFMYKSSAKGYYIDYAFVHQSQLPKIKNFQIGTFEDWIKHSDHMPLFLEI